MVCYELTVRDGLFADGPSSAIPYLGAKFYTVPIRLGVEDLWARAGLILEAYPKLPILVLLWAGMALVVSLASGPEGGSSGSRRPWGAAWSGTRCSFPRGPRGRCPRL
jgi:hypothetical protein